MSVLVSALRSSDAGTIAAAIASLQNMSTETASSRILLVHDSAICLIVQSLLSDNIEVPFICSQPYARKMGQ